MNFAELAITLNEGAAAQDHHEVFGLINYLEDKPFKTIVEIGMYRGGMCAVFRKTFPFSKIVAVDMSLVKYPYREEFDTLVKKYDFDYVLGDSQKEETLKVVLEKLGSDKIDFLYIDGGHDYDNVKRDWDLWSPYAEYIGFHDIFGFQCDVPIFWAELIKEQNDYAIWKAPAGMGIGLICKQNGNNT